MRSQMDFCAHCMVNVLQNVSQKRSNKRISREDIRYAVAAAYLVIYPGKTMYTVLKGDQKNAYGHFPHGDLYCVKKVNGQNRILWKITYYTAEADTAKNIVCESRGAPTSIVGVNLNDISINEGEMKIVLHCYSFFTKEARRRLLDDRSTLDISARESFGFWFLNPKEFDRDSNDKGNSFFPAIVVFTPKSGLFSESAPS